MPTVVLVVDDFDICRELACEILRCGGYRVLSADSAAAAIDQVERLGANDNLVLVSDYSLPDMNGVELCRRVKTKMECSTILCSGDSYAVNLRALEPGLINALLPKPYSVRSMRAIVAELSERLTETCVT